MAFQSLVYKELMFKVEAIAANKSINNINSDRSYNLPKTRTFTAIDKIFQAKVISRMRSP
ncbi:MAG: hypothetical protein F6K24_30355 [Okeania sp. SIO2D1]|nr:hypothetical protein [Okeania sp. SIO2D1]